MILYQNQRLPTSQKNDEWRKKTMNYFCNIADDFYTDWYRMNENYALKNNQLNQEDYAQVCKNLGDTGSSIFINAYNKTHNIIEAMRGEEWNRPFSFSVINESPRVANRIDREKRRMIDSVVGSIYEAEIAKQEEIIQAQSQAQNEQEMQKKMQAIQERYAKIFKNIPNIQEIFDKYPNINAIEDMTISSIMKMMCNKYNIKFIKNRCFEDALLAGVEAVEVYIEREGSLPKIREVNPLQLFFEKSPDVMFIHQADYAGYKQYLTIGKAIEMYQDRMTKEDYEKLTKTGYYNGITGLNHPFSTVRQAPSQWREVLQMGRFPNGNSLQHEQMLTLDEKYGGPNFGYIGSKYISTIGLSATEQRRNLSQYIQVYHVYWKSQRKLGKLNYVNEYNEIETTFVDEEFVVPKNATKELTASHLGKASETIYTWYDNENKKYSLTWIWVPEVWQGVRIGSDVYIDVGPVKHAYQSILDPYEVKLPIHGYIYNNRNAFTVSPMDRMKPWQKLYYIIMARLIKLISQDRGTWVFLNTLMFDKDLGVERTIAVAEDQGLITYNPLSQSKGAGFQNTFKVAETVNLSNSQMVQYYMELLQFIEQNIKLAAGMSDQRLAQSNPRMTATDNYRETMHSVNMTEGLHASHDLLWEQILQTLMEMTVSVLSENKGLLRGFLTDEENTIVDLDLIDLEDNFSLKIGDNSKAYKILEQVKGLSQALIQNDKASLTNLIDLLGTENLNEFRAQIAEIEEASIKRMQDQQTQQQQHEKEMLQMQLKAKEDDQIHGLDMTYLKGLLDYSREEMKAQYANISFDSDKDYNKDGIADYLQLAQLQQRIQNESDKIKVEAAKIGQREREISMSNQIKQQDILNKQMDSEKERDLKLKIAKIQESMKAKQLKK